MLRRAVVLLAMLFLAGEGSAADNPPADGAADVAPEAPGAATMEATVYDDGLACPGGCDAHVVVNKADNGTANVYLPPLSSRSEPERCRYGKPCVICFGPSGESCMIALYRGPGPPKGKIDLTPAFLDARCGEAGVPEAVARACASVERRIARHKYDVRVNCILSEDADPRCAERLAPYRAAQRADAVERARCVELGGDAEYNAQQPDAQLHRALGCNYLQNQRGSNSRGVTWRKLAPGSCDGSKLVGRDGLDCCSASRYAAGAFHPECDNYYLPAAAE